MSRLTLEARSDRIIERSEPDAADRLVDLAIEVRQSEYCAHPGRLIGFRVGGKYDTLEHRFVGPAETCAVIEADPGQIETFEAWFCWFRAYVTGEWADWHARYGARPYSFWTVGGRRKGKTWVGVACVALFAVALAGSFPWIVSAVEDDFLENEEIPRYWRRMVPADWYEWDEREMAIILVNGSRIELRSAHDPAKLKTGEASYAFLNEAQKKPQNGYDNLKGAIADSGSIVFVAANPPRLAVGYWTQDIVEKLRRGEVDGYLKEFHELNPHVHEAALDSMAKEMSARDYAIEREGRFMARTDIVLHAFETGSKGNVQPIPNLGEITDEFLRRKIGRPKLDRPDHRIPWLAVVGADFQLAPHMAAVVKRYYMDSEDPADALSWTVDEVIVEQGDEDDLVDGLEALGLNGATTAVIADASGDWQQADRKRGKLTGRGSFDMFRARGWNNLYKPGAHSERNPLILERVAVGNARLRSHDARQHAFVAPHCVLTAEALQKWPNGKEGFPSRYSQYAHIGDAWTYPEFRLWPRQFKRREGGGAPRRVHVIDIHGRDDRGWT